MKTVFSLGFQSHDPFTVQHPSLAGRPSLGRAIPLRPMMGQDNTASSEFEHVADANAQAIADLRTKLSPIIADGTKRLAAIRSWIAARINQDPTLVKSFGGDQVVASNFLSFNDMVTGDQSYVDMATQKLASNDPANWDFSDGMLGRIDEWSKGIDTMASGIQSWGVALPSAPVTTIPAKLGPAITAIVNPKTGTAVVSSIAPGATLKTTKPPASGLSTNTLLIGGLGAAALVGLVFALKG